MQVELALEIASPLGETPVWNAAEQCLYWIDSPSAEIHRFDPASGEDERLPASLDGYLGAIALCRDGGLLVLAGKSLGRLAPGSAKLQPLAEVEADLPDNLPNDGKVDAAGRFWFGTMHGTSAEPSGGLYRFAPGEGVRLMDRGFACANGMGWSPDGGTFYFVDMMPGRILAYDFDATSGSLGGRRIFATLDPAEGLPDGLSVDAEGGVWVAHWDGWCLSRFDARGRRTEKVALPVPRPTCPVFGGPGLRTLYVTSSAADLPDEVRARAPLSGSLFALAPGVAGVPVATFAG